MFVTLCGPTKTLSGSIHLGVYLLCEGLVLKWSFIDLHDALVFLEDILPPGATVFLDAFNMKAQRPCSKPHTVNIMCQTLVGENQFIRWQVCACGVITVH